MIARLWIIVSAVLLITAAVFLGRNNLSAAFVTAALGSVAWFLSYRSRLRAKVAAAEHDSNEERTIDESDEH